MIDAAGELLVEQGWAHATSVAVCARAGLTRGAFAHHFAGLGELFAAVLEDRYQAIATDVDAKAASTAIVELIEGSWAMMGNPGFKVVLEAWLARANDRELARMLDPVIENFSKLFGPDRWPELLGDDAARAFFLAARESLLGLAWGRAVNGGHSLAHEEVVLDHLMTIARTHDARLGHPGGQP